MKNKNFLVILAVSLVLIAAGLAFNSRPIGAEDQGADQELSKKLSEIADNQKKIFSDIAEIKEDLRIIKIRITQNQ